MAEWTPGKGRIKFFAKFEQELPERGRGDWSRKWKIELAWLSSTPLPGTKGPTVVPVTLSFTSSPLHK